MGKNHYDTFFGANFQIILRVLVVRIRVKSEVIVEDSLQEGLKPTHFGQIRPNLDQIFSTFSV